jgi:hypothetical protein
MLRRWRSSRRSRARIHEATPYKSHATPVGGDAGYPDRGRLRAGLRGERVARRRRAQEHPAEIVAKLNKEITASLADPGMKAQIVDAGGTVLAGSPADFGHLFADETERWARVIRAGNIKPE